MCASSAVLEPGVFLRTGIAISLFYTGGMFLNDAFDSEFDRRARPERPIPAGDVSRGEVFLLGGVLLAFGELLLGPNREAQLLGVALATVIVLYDYHHKASIVAPFIMGSCRGLVYLIAAALAGGLNAVVGLGAAVMALYVAGITGASRLAGSNSRWLIPSLIAGISLLDAAFIAVVSSSAVLTLVAASGCALTLALQRIVPGD